MDSTASAVAGAAELAGACFIKHIVTTNDGERDTSKPLQLVYRRLGDRFLDDHLGTGVGRLGDSNWPL